MSNKHEFIQQVWVFSLCAAIFGCGGGYTPTEVNEEGVFETTGAANREPGAATTDTVNGEPGSAAEADDQELLLRPYDPPTLEELDAQAEWEDQPVLDALDLMRERQSKEKVLATAQAALALRNNSDAANAKILSALGRLPATDAAVNWDASINRHSRADLKSTNPLMGSSSIEFEVGSLTGLGLFSFDWNFLTLPFSMCSICIPSATC
ncbi:MAG: hypothetical protein IH897_15895 [Planctomycetes bacterium]|nr:hypothetical protein [Planctomycetota bacterium]